MRVETSGGRWSIEPPYKAGGGLTHRREAVWVVHARCSVRGAAGAIGPNRACMRACVRSPYREKCARARGGHKTMAAGIAIAMASSRAACSAWRPPGAAAAIVGCACSRAIVTSSRQSGLQAAIRRDVDLNAVVRRMMVCKGVPSLTINVCWVRVAESDECASAKLSMRAPSIRDARGAGVSSVAQRASQGEHHGTCVVNVLVLHSYSVSVLISAAWQGRGRRCSHAGPGRAQCNPNPNPNVTLTSDAPVYGPEVHRRRPWCTCLVRRMWRRSLQHAHSWPHVSQNTALQ